MYALVVDLERNGGVLLLAVQFFAAVRFEFKVFFSWQVEFLRPSMYMQLDGSMQEVATAY